MSQKPTQLTTCGCCEGVVPLTPASVENQPGLSALAYRTGIHGSFKTTMLSALSAEPALGLLTIRDDDDPAIALCDAWATVLDVLTFYQERIANEGYLRTATERRSVLEMARSIGYELGPGVAATTYLAFNLETAQGAPDEARIPEGTRAQSVPGQDEFPQVYETVEEIHARGVWNVLKPLTREKVIPGFGAKEIFLRGIVTGLKPGDGLLMIGAEREADAGSERWDFRRVKEVVPDQDGIFTKVTWDEGLGWQIFSRKVLPAEQDFQVFAMRQQAFLFGHNAPDWRIMSTCVKDEFRTCGLHGEYYDNINFTGTKRKRTDSEVDFRWGAGKPHPDIASNTFSVRWTGFIRPERSGYYTFHTISDDGVRLWVNDKQIIDNWTDHAETQDNSKSIWLEAARLYEMRLDYYEKGGTATIILKWSGPDIAEEVIAPTYLYPPGNYNDWPHGFNIAAISGDPDADPIKKIYLDSLYPQIVEDSWIVLVTPEPKFYVEVYKVLNSAESSRKNFTLTAKTTAVTLSGENLREKFNNSVRETVVFAQSEPLEISEQPITTPVQGHTITLDRQIADLNKGRRLIVSGKCVRVEVPDSVRNLKLKDQQVGQTILLHPKDSLIVAKTPELRPDGMLSWTLVDKFGRTGTVVARQGRLRIVSATKTDAIVNEAHVIKAVDPLQDPTVIELAQPLAHTLDRSTVTIFANVAKATHGETKREVVGGADGSQAFQQFELKQKPLTHVSASTPSGTQSTLTVRVNDLLWEEVPTLNGQSPKKRCYTSRLADDGTVTVQFGDGRTGARPPTGAANVSAAYRVGSGLEGQVKAEQISMLLTQVLGVKGVVNPLAATGAADPEKLADARRNAPMTVLTFERIVSLQDYEDFANAFAGIGKAQANMLWDGEQRLVHLTVAGADGGGISSDSELYKNLNDGIDNARHPDHRVIVESFHPLTFDVTASVKIHPDYIEENVFQAIVQALQTAYAFDSRAFGQAVTTSGVQACIQKIDGVEALFLEELFFTTESPGLNTRLPVNLDQWRVGVNQPARLSTINPQGITLTKMTI